MKMQEQTVFRIPRPRELPEMKRAEFFQNLNRYMNTYKRNVMRVQEASAGADSIRMVPDNTSRHD